MAYGGLFVWWIATITWSIAFPIAVSVYLYTRKRPDGPARPQGGLRWVRDFSFVWFLLGLLAFYVAAVGLGSPLLFALGNLVVEALLLLYVRREARGTDPRQGWTREGR